ncbi:hypothetical protein CANCADRAFT_78724 [Tortispora caseinolytica NRRL Y-17796]|uniref:Pre-rRNA-processing protein PNO1 n=1 Tax=Tortispora caseinolytica NRRL Y-17796 TaxID=767744 RepID=A0A1E4TJH6_9ASCO|nr:hypothetical protein CANCADRAFT_78724 [Tortispora caseinolytica NRRL Y-17796]
MGAPTARKDVVKADPVIAEAEEDDMVVDTNVQEPESGDSGSTSVSMSNAMHVDSEGKPRFAASNKSGERIKFEMRKVPVPPNRMTPLKSAWGKIYPPLVSHLKLQVRMNTRTKTVELRTCRQTTDSGALQKGADFVRSFMLGFDVDDAIAMLRLDDMYIESFEVKDVKTLQGDNLSRAIGRIAGKDGKTKFAIENATKTRIVVADSKIHIMGGFTNIRMARESVVSLILGSPPGKVYNGLRVIAARLKESY